MRTVNDFSIILYVNCTVHRVIAYRQFLRPRNNANPEISANELLDLNLPRISTRPSLSPREFFTTHRYKPISADVTFFITSFIDVLYFSWTNFVSYLVSGIRKFRLTSTYFLNSENTRVLRKKYFCAILKHVGTSFHSGFVFDDGVESSTSRFALQNFKKSKYDSNSWSDSILESEPQGTVPLRPS